MTQKIMKGIIVHQKKERKNLNRGSAIYSEDGILIMEQRNNKYCGAKTLNEINLQNKEQCDMSDLCVVYMGQLTSHYGHFLLESLCRFWIFLNKYAEYIVHNSNYKYVFTEFLLENDAGLNNILLKKVLQILQINSDKFMLLKKMTRFKEIIVYEPSCEINHKLDERHKELCDQLVYNVITKNPMTHRFERIFISRNMHSEKNIIKILQKYNFVILHPKDQNFFQNIFQYNSASIIAGFEGTNIHNILFSKPYTKLIVFDHRNRYTVNQTRCDSVSLAKIFYIKPQQQSMKNIKNKIRMIIN